MVTQYRSAVSVSFRETLAQHYVAVIAVMDSTAAPRVTALARTHRDSTAHIAITWSLRLEHLSGVIPEFYFIHSYASLFIAFIVWCSKGSFCG